VIFYETKGDDYEKIRKFRYYFCNDNSCFDADVILAANYSGNPDCRTNTNLRERDFSVRETKSDSATVGEDAAEQETDQKTDFQSNQSGLRENEKSRLPRHQKQPTVDLLYRFLISILLRNCILSIKSKNAIPSHF
jgi:hypothetical protein